MCWYRDPRNLRTLYLSSNWFRWAAEQWIANKWDDQVPSNHWLIGFSLVMGPGQKFLTLVGSIFCCSGQVAAIFGLENFPLKSPIFQFFSLCVKKKSHCARSKSTWVKDRSASNLLRVRTHLLDWNVKFLIMHYQISKK